MNQIVENINRILSEWNPIGVPNDIAFEEYRRYIPIILKSASNREKLMDYLKGILINEMEIGYDPSSEEHISDLRSVCEKIISASGVTDIPS